MPAAGYKLRQIKVVGIDRQQPAARRACATLAVLALPKAALLLRRARADAVIGAGGYVAGPVGLAAALLRIPLFLCEADSHLGMANRLLARFARRVFLSFPIPGRESGRSRSAAGRCRPAPARRTGRRPACASEWGSRSRVCSSSAARSAPAPSIGRQSRRSAPRRPAPSCTRAASATIRTCAPGWTLWGRLRTTTSTSTYSPLPTRWQPPIWSPRGPAARCWRWPRPASRPCSCPIRTRPRTIRPRTLAGWSARAPRWGAGQRARRAATRP